LSCVISRAALPTFADLKIEPDTFIKMAQAKDGILLVCGATGSGKSSTMAAMLNWINQNMDKHIVTIEDPIEYTFSDDKSLFQQREIGLDVPSFELAIKSVLRQNPDIILIGEMRDRETFETAISAAETGHLVISTMHAATVKQSLTRLFEFFPPEQIEQARRQIAGTLRGFICQKLIPALEGGGRFAAHEILIADATVSNLILDGHNDKIQQLLESGSDGSSKSFNKDLYRLIKEGKISKADGMRFSPNAAGAGDEPEGHLLQILTRSCPWCAPFCFVASPPACLPAAPPRRRKRPSTRPSGIWRC
jgi:twitching motility protein PilT